MSPSQLQYLMTHFIVRIFSAYWQDEVIYLIIVPFLLCFLDKLTTDVFLI
jgi:hypothetical protein